GLGFPIGVRGIAVGAQSRRGAEPQESRALLRFPVREVRRADEDVGVAVTVHVAGRSHRLTEVGVVLGRLGMPRSIGQGGRKASWQAQWSTRKYEGATLREARGARITGGAHDEIVEAIAVHVAGVGDRSADLSLVLIAAHRPVRRAANPARAAI